MSKTIVKVIKIRLNITTDLPSVAESSAGAIATNIRNRYSKLLPVLDTDVFQVRINSIKVEDR